MVKQARDDLNQGIYKSQAPVVLLKPVFTGQDPKISEMK
jgi:hypothetical protein